MVFLVKRKSRTVLMPKSNMLEINDRSGGSQMLDNSQLLTRTISDQEDCENLCRPLLESSHQAELTRDKHIAQMKRQLAAKSHGSLDATRSWLIYWSLNSLRLLDFNIEEYLGAAGTLLLQMQTPTGGFGGNIGHMAHMASSYSAVLALCLTKNESLLKSIDRESFKKWLLAMKVPGVGAFRSTPHGEFDSRMTYCAICIASLLNLLDEDITKDCFVFLAKCQSIDGGFSAVPGIESHAGYTFCALAALFMLRPPGEIAQIINVPNLVKWLSSRQLPVEGGFNGRTNKLVDGCYNHWVGGCWPFASALLQARHEGKLLDTNNLFSRSALIDYALCCCQDPKGGCRDKPSKYPDPYHTCYVLAGLSEAINLTEYDFDSSGPLALRWKHRPVDESRMQPLNPVYVLPTDCAEYSVALFL